MSERALRGIVAYVCLFGTLYESIELPQVYTHFDLRMVDRLFETRMN